MPRDDAGPQAPAAQEERHAAGQRPAVLDQERDPGQRPVGGVAERGREERQREAVHLGVHRVECFPGDCLDLPCGDLAGRHELAKPYAVIPCVLAQLHSASLSRCSPCPEMMVAWSPRSGDGFFRSVPVSTGGSI